MKFVRDVRMLLIGLWLGAAAFFVAVAQVAFSALPQRELAGAVVGGSLSILNYAGVAIALVLLAASFLAARGSNRVLVWTERVLIAVLGLCSAASEFVIGLMLAGVRTRMAGKTIDEFAADDPLRLEFNRLHEYSVWLLIAAVCAGLLAFFVIANRNQAKAGQKDPLGPYNFEKEFKI
jgi:hypothetical protein